MKKSVFNLTTAKSARMALMGSAASLAMLAVPGAAFAQSAPAEDTAENVNDGAIIVRARRRDETLQEVPVTVTVIGGETLDRYSIDQVADVTSRVPTLNVQVGGSGSGGQLSLRGVGSSNISASFDSAVAFNMDGVQVSTMRLVQAGFFDTQQIDVLRGPQSLFFGKSASAGVFSIRSADPTSDWEVGGKGSYEFEEQGYLVEGYVSGPLTETLGIRVAAQYNDIDKLVRLQEGTPAVNQNRGSTSFIGRTTLDWKPVEGFNANLKVQYVKNTSDGAFTFSDVDCGPNGVADPISLLVNPVTGIAGFQFASGYDCNTGDQRYFYPDTAAPLAASVPAGPLATGPSLAEGFDGVPFGETELWFGRLALDFGLTDSLTLSSTTGFLDLDATDVDNYSSGGLLAPGLAGGVGTSDPRNTLTQYSQELRLTSEFDSSINFMVGAFYEWRKFGFDTSQQGINAALFFGPDPDTGFTFDWDKNHITKTEATSFFGSLIIDLTDRLELSGGVRYTDESKTQFIEIPYVHGALAAFGFVESGFLSGPISFSDSNLSPEFTLKYQASDDLNVFASFKTGFKSGGIDNSALPSGSLNGFGDFTVEANGNTRDQNVRDGLRYASETAIGGEVGVKSQLADRAITFNATAYYYVFDDLQVQNFDAVNTQFITLNAGQLTTKGVDVNLGWNPNIDGLSFSGNLSYLDAKFTDTFISATGDDLDGRVAPRAPEWSGNLAFDYLGELNDSLAIGVGGNVIYSDSYNTNQASLNDDIVQDSYVTFDGRVSVGHPEGKWQLSLIGVNLNDKVWVNTSGQRPFLDAVGDDQVVTQNRGRQVFVEASFKF